MVTNTLQVDNTSGVPQTLTVSGNTFNPKNGMLFTGNSAIVLDSATGVNSTTDLHVGTAATDNEDVIFHNVNARGVTIALPVTNLGTGSGNSGRQGWITYSGSGSYTITGTQTVSSGGGFAFNTNGSTTLDGDLASANNVATTMAISRGSVVLGSNYRSGNTISATNPNLNLAMAGGASLDLNGIQTQFDALQANDLTNQAGGDNFNAGLITNSSSTPVELRLVGATASAGTTGFYPGVITGNISLVVAKVGSNTSQRLANAHTYTGSTTIRAGSTLILTRYGNLPSTTDLTLGDASTAGILLLGDVGGTNGAVNQTVASLNSTVAASQINGQNGNVSVLTVNNASANSYTGSLVGNLALRKTSSGSLTLLAGSVANTYVGGTSIEGGEIVVGADARLGVIGAYTGAAATIAPVAGTPLTSQANNVVLNGGNLHTTATFTLQAGRGIGVGPIDGSLGGSGGIEVDVGTTLTFAGVIANAGNTGSNTLNKLGTGTLLLNGASTMAGQIIVGAGTLGGSGSVSSSVNVLPVAFLAPGNSVGTFTVGGSLDLDGTLRAEFDGATLSLDRVNVAGNVDITNATLDLSILSPNGPAGTAVLVSYGSLTGASFASVVGLPGGWSINYAFNDGLSSNNIAIAYTPEPTSLFVLGAAGIVSLRRRR